MGLTKKSDGRYVVGKGIADGNEYKGSAAWRDIVIQYSGDGATEKSLEYLTFLKDYALYHSAQGNPVIPPNVQIWMSTANTMKAVEADDITVDGETVKIGACTWDGSAWSFAEPTPGGGGSSIPPYTSADKGKVLTVGEASPTVIIPEQTVGGDAMLSNTALEKLNVGDSVTVNINGNDYQSTWTNMGFTYDVSSSLTYSISNVGAFMAYNPKSSQIVAGQYTISCTISEPQVVTIVVPEQTITITQHGAAYYGELSGVEIDIVSPPDSITTTVSVPVLGITDMTVEMVKRNINGAPLEYWYIGDPMNLGVVYSGGEWAVPGSSSVSGLTFTLSSTVNIPDPEIKWESDVIFIPVTTPTDSGNAADYAIVENGQELSGADVLDYISKLPLRARLFIKPNADEIIELTTRQFNLNQASNHILLGVKMTGTAIVPVTVGVINSHA